MYKLGSHDTMTYLKPRDWWLRPFKFVAQCQRVPIEEQYEKYGIKLFDIRVKYNSKERIWELAHGAMVFKGKTPDEVFEYLNSLNDEIYVRLVLEYNRAPKDIDIISSLFAMQASKWREKYSNITFWGFNRKYDWKRLYEYEGMKELSMYQAISSATWKIWDDWFPWLYAWFHNADNIKQGTDKEWLLIDFVDMR